MSPVLAVATAFAAGALLGAGYFRALWWTVSALERSKRPGLRIATSLALRFAAVLGVLYLIARYGGWPPLLAAVAGFTVVRFLAVRRVGSGHGGSEADG